jgi:serpin B
MRIVDFQTAADAARAAINTWVSERTHGRISKLLGPGDVDPSTRLVLVNAVYLKAKWLLAFDKQATFPAVFHSPGGAVEVATMHQTGTFGYLRGAGYRALELPYRGGRLAFDILLPNRGQLQLLLSSLTSKGPLRLLRGLRPQRVQLALPKFRLRTRFELADALETLGMPLAFEPGRADLSAIAGQPGLTALRSIVSRSSVWRRRCSKRRTRGSARRNR